MESANIQQALAIYRLSDALIPTAVVGNVQSLSLESWDGDSPNDALQLYFSQFNSPYISKFYVEQTIDGWEPCQRKLSSHLSQYPLSPIQLNTTPKTHFVAEVNAIKSLISQKRGSKIVAARTTVIEKVVDETSLWQSFEMLCSKYPSAFVFLLMDPTLGTWMGATPERLIEWKQDDARIMSLAGTLTQSQADWTGKERSEQTVTSGFIREKVEALGLIPVESEVRELAMGNIRHLMSDWHFPLERSLLHSFIRGLHPTPAVGGYPQEWAVNWILENEGFDRCLYAGFIGIETPNLANYQVVLRCCSVGSNGYMLYGGCGVNEASDPEIEWQETSAKMQLIASYL